MLDAGADINHQEVNGKTALHWAVRYNQVELTKVLLEAGADVTIKDKEEKTPLHFAASGWESPRVIKLLLDYGRISMQRVPMDVDGHHYISRFIPATTR